MPFQDFFLDEAIHGEIVSTRSVREEETVSKLAMRRNMLFMMLYFMRKTKCAQFAFFMSYDGDSWFGFGVGAGIESWDPRRVLWLCPPHIRWPYRFFFVLKKRKNDLPTLPHELLHWGLVAFFSFHGIFSLNGPKKVPPLHLFTNGPSGLQLKWRELFLTDCVFFV